jgi:hypothetical protein
MNYGFTDNYYQPMDRDYGQVVRERQERKFDESASEVSVGIGELGTSIALGPVKNLAGVNATMRSGAKTVELNFSGAGKGNAQNQTPGMYGEKQRQALREMQKANDYEFTVHATYGIMGLAGQDQQGNFSRSNQKMALDEIKRAIEFAADTTKKGSIVVHAGEFSRPFEETDWEGDDQDKFIMHQGERSGKPEDKDAAFYVVDNRSGRVIQQARMNQKVSQPVWNMVEKGQEYYEDVNGQLIKKVNSTEDPVYVDYDGIKIDRSERVPVYDSQSNQFKIKKLTWDELKKEAVNLTKEAQAAYDRFKKNEPLKPSDEKWERFMRDDVKREDVKIRPEEASIITILETQASQAKGWAYYYSRDFDDQQKLLENIRKLREGIQNKNEDEIQKVMSELQKKTRLDEEDLRNPEKLIELKENIKRNMKQAQEGSASQFAQAQEQMETIKHIQSAHSYALERSFDAYADAGITAYYKTQERNKKGFKGEPLFIAMENIFPESYGAHPDELKKLVLKSQEAMANKLKAQGVEEKKAKELAETHIGATFDTGHFNIWRKYWKGDSNKSIAENDKDFQKWAINKVEDLAKSGVVKHLHIVDNYGYQDDHLAPGQGNTPIKEMVKKFKDNGFKGKIIVEPGADFTTDRSGFKAMTKTWEYFGNTLTSGGMGSYGGRNTWSNVQYGGMSQIQPPYFTVGAYSPSEDWKLWSGVPLE